MRSRTGRHLGINRRAFLKASGATLVAPLVISPPGAQAARPSSRADTYAVLVDSTRCVGCRACEAACSEANRLPDPVMAGEAAVFDRRRTPDPRSYTVVNRYPAREGTGRSTFVKTQCMHCVEPACASACLVKALERTPEGAVVYHRDRCLGCRYCMVACPFGTPTFEYGKVLPYVRKCGFCLDRQRQGQPPACAEVCPSGALRSGRRTELLHVARARVYRDPTLYVEHIYGEHEVGGAGWLYLAAVPFEDIGFREDLGTTSYAQLTWSFLSAVPFVLTLWPPLLMGLYAFTKTRQGTTHPPRGTEKEAHRESDR